MKPVGGDKIFHLIPFHFICGKIRSCGPNLSKRQTAPAPCKERLHKGWTKQLCSENIFLLAPQLNTAAKAAGIKGKDNSSIQ